MSFKVGCMARKFDGKTICFSSLRAVNYYGLWNNEKISYQTIIMLKFYFLIAINVASLHCVNDNNNSIDEVIMCPPGDSFLLRLRLQNFLGGPLFTLLYDMTNTPTSQILEQLAQIVADAPTLEKRLDALCFAEKMSHDLGDEEKKITINHFVVRRLLDLSYDRDLTFAEQMKLHTRASELLCNKDNKLLAQAILDRLLAFFQDPASMFAECPTPKQS